MQHVGFGKRIVVIVLLVVVATVQDQTIGGIPRTGTAGSECACATKRHEGERGERGREREIAREGDSERDRVRIVNQQYKGSAPFVASALDPTSWTFLQTRSS